MQKYDYVIGIDPGSSNQGVAIYHKGKLINLCYMQDPELINDFRYKSCLFSIEDVTANSFIYTRNEQSNKKKQGRVGQNVGMCKQSQICLMRWLDYCGMTYVVHKPQAGNWAKTALKPLFERATGWEGRSNHNTRSAAFFGFLEINKCN